jgi:F-type H+-transporting ATPase subunit delta
VEEIANVYARSLFEVAKEHDKLDDVKDQLGQFTDELDSNRELQVLWAEENQLLPVTITSAVELEDDTVKDLAKRIEDQTGRQIELTTTIDTDLIGGLQMRVGNMIYDATIKNRLEKLRREVARAA